MAEGQTPGNGNTAPFGNGDGATQAAGPSSGAHDFIADPKSNSPATGGRDFNKESRPQRTGAPGSGCNPTTVPGGGLLPYPTATPDNGGKPFSLKGGEAAAPAPDMSEGSEE